MQHYRLGIDVGSTTIKIAVLDDDNNIVYKYYDRHYAKVRERAAKLLAELEDLLAGSSTNIAVTGSAGLGLAKSAGLEFVQEVFATKIAVEYYHDDIDAVIELGGEDAKILFLTGGAEERMNGSCAGGTGAFIDQMAALLGVSLAELDKLSLEHATIYSIASRCGVFAKSDIQPLLNQGANKADIAASIYQAVVDQTVTGLAQGREIKGRVVFLGGPLTFQKGLGQRFRATLGLGDEDAIFPDNSEFYVALGAALYSGSLKPMGYTDIMSCINKAALAKNTVLSLPPLFSSRAEYAEFLERHRVHSAKAIDIGTYEGDAYLGIDAGSTTLKLVLASPDGGILYSYYKSNLGEPVQLVKDQLKKIYEMCGRRIKIRAAASTGYGEELIKNAFRLDSSLVETVAHYFAARYFDPLVDFILDIGGQDIKCFRVRNNAIDSIMLNEACSSGCGSFMETCAHTLGYSIEEFADMALFARHPVNLGSRCTVFMNSSIKQAQKDGSGIDDIAAGLAISVVKNALYKVIRINNPAELGSHIVVQGGTFMNDAILRSFELETGKHVTRPDIAGLMGAFGAALYAATLNTERSGMLSYEELNYFTHTSRAAVCEGCTNKCKLTINTFGGSGRFISGNRCERPLGKGSMSSLPNAYGYKLEKLQQLEAVPGPLGRIGIPLGLNMYENLPFWHALLTHMGFEVVVSGISTREIYSLGQHTIPSDTICYPAKLMHGHILKLLEMGIDTIFYPCMPYNFDEHLGDNHYNCPVVSYYPELLKANIKALDGIRFMYPYFNPGNRKNFTHSLCDFFGDRFNVSRKTVEHAVDKAYQAYRAYRADIEEYGRKALEFAKANGRLVILLSGRPYHIDPEINHGIDKLANSLGLVVLSEDCVSHYINKFRTNVLNQWAFHSRLYAAAKFATLQDNVYPVQLVSFGCGLDAITSDEMRYILESGSKLYTQIKIDEISNLGAAKIRLRSLMAAVELSGGTRHEKKFAV
ncbi:MAG TPA: acyl-CoA dehydratase activase [Candidatus Atribacteria bacterium]|nr:acyl-CoA dehydratase activase [Candidatus Atribacteria bacterium]